MEATVQLNVRMPRDLRDAGNAALESKGITPSEFVRAAWDTLARRGRDLESLLSVVTAAQETPVQVEDNPIDRGQLLYMDALRSMGVSHAAEATGERPFNEMVEDALVERWAERGLVDGR